MRERYIHILSIAIVLTGFAAVTFLYWSEPRSLAEVATKGSVAIGTYAVDRAEFERGLAAFRAESFAEARSAFDRADPEKRDALAQFYVAYSFYRQGWGTFTNDDALFRSGIEAANRVTAIDPNFRVNDPTLGMKTPAELRAELEEGLKITIDDLNPLKLTRERK
jgi:hypothetical protein